MFSLLGHKGNVNQNDTDSISSQSEWLSSRKQTTDAGEDAECQGKGTLICCSWECKLFQPTMEISMEVPQNLKIELPYDSAIPFWAHIRRNVNHYTT
jgi:hypothetical protein